jgi:hypothetical protein
MTRPSAALSFFTLILITTPAHAYRDLCLSVSSACEWSGPTAPLYNADVCWSKDTGVRVKGTAPCPSGSNPYHLKYGEVVNGTTGSIQAYAPLDDACAHDLCIDGPAPGDTTAMAICCEFGGCIEIVPGWACDGPDAVAYYCDDGVCNEDGTVDCFAGELL